MGRRRRGDSRESFQDWAKCGNSRALCQPFGGRGSSEPYRECIRQGLVQPVAFRRVLVLLLFEEKKTILCRAVVKQRLLERVGTALDGL